MFSKQLEKGQIKISVGDPGVERLDFYVSIKVYFWFAPTLSVKSFKVLIVSLGVAWLGQSCEWTACFKLYMEKSLLNFCS